MLKVWMLALVLFPIASMAAEFKHIKLNPQFQRYLTPPKLKSSALKTAALTSDKSTVDNNEANTIFAAKVQNALLGINSDINSPIPVDGEESLLYEEIRRQLEHSHRTIGLGAVDNINRLNRDFNLGSQNYSGFSWQKPFGVVQVYADRQVTPNAFADNWLIQDTFTFSLEASSFLEKTNEAGLTAMSATEIQAFAGITFKRVYTSYHYAASYMEGLGVDFSKLFLPFTKFNELGMERMGNEEIVKREDTWTASAGGLITTPPLYNLSFSAGILAEAAHQQMTSIQSNHTQDPAAQRFQLNVLSKQSKSVGATLELQLDFFKLIKLSLLRADMNYEYTAGKEYKLSFSTPQWEVVKADPLQGKEFRRIMKGQGSVNLLEPYVVRVDDSTSSAIEARGSVLIWGKLQKSKTETIHTIKDQTVRTFYKNYSQSVKVVQNILSRLFSAVVYKIFKLPIGATNAAIYRKQLTMEYEDSHPQSQNSEVARIDSTEKFSFVLTQSYNAARTDRWLDRKFKNDVIWFVEKFTTLPADFRTNVRQGNLKGPLTVESNLRVEKAGFDFLLASSDDRVFGLIANVCQSKKAQLWSQTEERISMLKSPQQGPESCVKDIGKRFLGFKIDYAANAFRPSLAKFKDFLAKYYKKSENISSLQNLFGPENTFINGSLKAVSSTGTNFTFPFSAGQFRGLGVIDNFNRGIGSRMPASIPNE